MSEASYRYKAVDGTCKYSASEAYKNVVVVQHNFVAVDDVSALQAAIAQQPISVGIDATCLAFRFYSSGVFDDANCGTDLDHAVLATGYGVEGGLNYFNVKNSWNTDWGEQGYIKIAVVRGKGICGIQMDPLYPVLQ